jgi:hypothetical protein
MQTPRKISLIAFTAILVGAAAAPSMAQPARAMFHAIPYDSYQGPRGGYASLSDYVRDVEGIPCGTQCTLAAQQRWSQSRPE